MQVIQDIWMQTSTCLKHLKCMTANEKVRTIIPTKEIGYFSENPTQSSIKATRVQNAFMSYANSFTLVNDQ